MSDMARPFGVWTATAMVVGGMIGAGIFALPGQLAPLGWTSLVGWLVCGVGVLAIGRVIAEFAVQRPKEPSILTTCGDVLGLLSGRLLTWIYWCTIFVSLPVISMTAAAYLLHLFPSVEPGPWPQALLGTAILTLLALNNLRGAKAVGFLQVVTTVLKLIPLIAVIGIVAFLALSAPETYTETTAAPFSMSELTPALGIIFFAMLSFENAALVAERVQDPARNVMRATLFGLAAVLVIYLVVSTGITFAVPAGELSASSAPIAYFVGRNMGPMAGDAVALFAAISAIGCLNALVLLLGELPLGLVRDGQLPEWMARTTVKSIAYGPLLLGTALGIVLLLASVTALGDKVLDFGLRLTTATSIFFYLGITIAALKEKVRPVMALIGTAFSLWVLYGTGLEAGLLSFALLLVGVPLHFLIGGRTTPRNTAPAG